MSYPSPHELNESKKNFNTLFLSLLFSTIFISFFLYIIFSPNSSEAAIVKVQTNLDDLPYYINGDDVFHFEFTSDSATTTNNNTLCIRPNTSPSCAGGGSGYAIGIAGSNFATDTDEITGSTTPYYTYVVNIPIVELFDTYNTTSVDISQILLNWGGLNTWIYRSAPYTSGQPADTYVFHYDKFGKVPVTSEKIAEITITSISYGVFFGLILALLSILLAKRAP